jgi:predicted ribosomally synthesized peptide with nif11-like leader
MEWKIMSVDNIEKFGEAVKNDAALQDELKAAGSDLAKIVSIAASKGFDFTEEELKEYSAKKKGEMSDEDLEKVSGGGLAAVSVVAVI